MPIRILRSTAKHPVFGAMALLTIMLAAVASTQAVYVGLQNRELSEAQRQAIIERGNRKAAEIDHSHTRAQMLSAVASASREPLIELSPDEMRRLFIAKLTESLNANLQAARARGDSTEKITALSSLIEQLRSR